MTIALTVMGTPACSGEPSAGERALCSSLQEVITSIERGDRQHALAEFTQLGSLAQVSGNATMEREGSALFEYLATPVEGYEDMTISETAEFANQALERSVTHLGALADECARVGDAIEISDPQTLRIAS